MGDITKIGFGGGCHWCTEAVFQSLKGVTDVEQGWIASEGENFAFSEAVTLKYDRSTIPLEVLLEIHLYTHKSTSEHSMREKYRSAVYVFTAEQEADVRAKLNVLQDKFENKLITQVLRFSEFKPSREQIKNYYYKNPQKPFCETFINPKLNILFIRFTAYADKKRLKHLNSNPYKHHKK